MRLVHVLIPIGRLEDVLDELDDEGIDYAVSEEIGRGEYEAQVSFPLPTSAVEPVLTRLRGVGLEEAGYTIVVSAETVVSKRFAETKKKYTDLSLSRAELVSRAEDMAPPLSTFVVMTIVSAVVATTGLLSNSAAVIIGAMIIAPVMGPAISASVGSVLYEPKLFRRGVGLQVLGVLLAIASGLVFSLLVKETLLVPPGFNPIEVPQVQERLTPNILSLVLAVGAGVAAVFSLTRGVSSVLVGAMIAVALVPPAATVGIGIAWDAPLAILEAGTLLLVNILAVNLVALSLLWVSGYRPVSEGDAGYARKRTIQLLGIITFSLLVLGVILSGVTLLSIADAQFKQNLNTEIADVLSQQRYQNVRLVEVHIDVSPVQGLLFSEDPEVTILVDSPGGVLPSGLAEAIRTTIKEEQGYDVIVLIEAVDASRPADDEATMTERVAVPSRVAI
ncbi:TIGR00341 family protein [Haloferax sp. MBLA0076]|uniref:TIGR00341 family protein n=1 Tax=Haloferax litoreum TaxID=2666140 RepID=A0A6A8GJ02_9EURY|nr:MULTISPECIES: TIGR00341 family protein [Haloferax]KAB1193194.1 TIGR00341 family protein [Haloferax sp. CBA1148]MRX21690.1 TIGR00341 family protein [Haloferax litoreum]